MLNASSLLKNYDVCDALKKCWNESSPGLTGGHEEGGFILHQVDDSLLISRWPIGLKNTITVPPHPNCQFEGKDIVATFHTHPNTGSNYLQEPSETDKRAVRDDPDLKGSLYIGELVISQQSIYLIEPTGQVRIIGETQTILR